MWAHIVDLNFAGPIAERAKFRGKTMADAFLAKINKAKAEGTV
jgi:hypothetical protein